jgi:hypothetical protein
MEGGIVQLLKELKFKQRSGIHEKMMATKFPFKISTALGQNILYRLKNKNVNPLSQKYLCSRLTSLKRQTNNCFHTGIQEVLL